MKRVQLFEFEDFNWFPNTFRNSMTNLIVVLHKMMKLDKVIAKLVRDTLQKENLNSIVDLGSGSGGSMPVVLDSILKENPDVTLTMTDLYPNPQAIKRFNKDGNASINYHPEPIDATNIASAPNGLKTMVNCFHHMRPEQAKSILKSAEKSGEPFLIYEMAENNMPIVLWWLLLHISLSILVVMCLLMTPFVKPLSWQQIVFTYLIPVIPIFYAWDGQASLPRMYTMKDMDVLLQDCKSDKYTWEKGNVLDSKGKKKGTFVLGRAV